MTGTEIRRIRAKLGMDQHKFGTALGYRGDIQTIRTDISRMECGHKAVPRLLGMLLEMIDRHGMPEEWTTATGDKP